jgi:hypothetical protein
VQKYCVAFRTSHKLVGALVKALIDSKQTLLDATPELLTKVAKESVGIQLNVKKVDIVECTNLRKLIETYKVQGGPSPAEVERAITLTYKTMTQTKVSITKLQENLTNAEKILNSNVKSCSQIDSSKNGRIENSKL